MTPLDAAGAHPTQAPPLPRLVQIEPVGQCNLRCQMCPIQFRKDGALAAGGIWADARFHREPDRVNFGNMLTHGVDAIWNGGAYQRFRDQLSSDEPSSLCRSCSLYRGTF
jgi:hypothetical protein